MKRDQVVSHSELPEHCRPLAAKTQIASRLRMDVGRRICPFPSMKREMVIPRGFREAGFAYEEYLLEGEVLGLGFMTPFSLNPASPVYCWLRPHHLFPQIRNLGALLPRHPTLPHSHVQAVPEACSSSFLDLS